MSPRLAQRKELGFSAAAEVALGLEILGALFCPFLHSGGGTHPQQAWTDSCDHKAALLKYGQRKITHE